MMGQSNRPLGGLRVGLSIGNSAEDGLARGFDSDQVNRVTVRLTRSLLAQGARVVLGHDWRRDGVMHAELDMAREYATERGDADAEPVIHSLVPWPDELAMSADERERWRSVLRIERLDLRLALAERGRARPAPDSREGLYLRAEALSDLRKRLVAESDARVCIGGRTHDFGGRFPGILEEAFWTARADQPLYVSGLLGGAAAGVIDALRGEACDLQPNGEVERAYREIAPDPDVSVETMAGALRELGVKGLRKRNRLDAEENGRLFDAATIDEVVNLVLIGLGRVAR